jgi:hypothetical protein
MAPALALVSLAPFVGEVLLGNTPLRLIFVYFVTLLMYGCGALLIRELSRRSGRGWPTILILGVAYGVVEEGLGDMSLFNPDFYGEHLLSYGNWLGIGWPWWLYVLTLHAVWSIGVSIALAEALFTGRGTAPWLGRTGLVVCVVVFALGLAFVHFAAGDGYQLTTGQLVLSLVLVAALAAVAFLLPGRRGPRAAADPRPAPSPWVAGAAAFALTGAFMALTRPLSDALHLPAGVLVAGYLVLYALAIGAVLRWSRQPGWGPEHRFALAAGALLTYVWYGFVQVPHDALDLVGQAVFALLAAVILALAGRRVARTYLPMKRPGGCNGRTEPSRSKRPWPGPMPDNR